MSKSNPTAKKVSYRKKIQLTMFSLSLILIKLFKAAISGKCPEQWSNYKRVRNEVTSDLRKAKSSYYSTIFNEVKSLSAYWNLLKRATNPKVRKNIGPLKKEDGTLELTDSERANLMTSYFATIGLKLSNTLPPPTSGGHEKTCTDKGETDIPQLTDVHVSVFSSGQNKGAKNKEIHGSS